MLTTLGNEYNTIPTTRILAVWSLREQCHLYVDQRMFYEICPQQRYANMVYFPGADPLLGSITQYNSTTRCALAG